MNTCLCEVSMIKGFVLFNEYQIPFVINNYHMELFTDDEKILNDFTKQYNSETNYVLTGQCFSNGFSGQNATFLVERSIGSTCFLRCYIIYMLSDENGYDAIGFQSPFLDDVFRYGYEYLNMVDKDINVSKKPNCIYSVPFPMKDHDYILDYRIGYDRRMGLLEDYNKKGECLLSLHSNNIQECYDLSIVLYRLAMYMISCENVPFKTVTLYQEGIKAGWFFSPLITQESFSGYGIHFHDFDVMKYIPKILNNIAREVGNEITESVPLGYLGDIDNMFSPHRFMEQMTAFEYLFDKLHHKEAQDKHCPLKAELEYMFNEFPELLSDDGNEADTVSTDIKEIRRQIAHGYTYYYDFKNDYQKQRLILLLDTLLRKMSLLWIGFTKDEISDFPML